MKITDELIGVIQKCISLRPVIVLGSGYSCQYGLAGMDQLANYLLSEIKVKPIDKTKWEEFELKIKSKIDLETALHEVTLPDNIEKEIIIKTRALVLSQDQKTFNDIIENDLNFPLTDLLTFINRTANPEIKIVTTNYDRLIEYAIDKANLIINDGFVGKYLKKFDKIKSNNNSNVELLKVHGSLDWFAKNKYEVFSVPDFINIDYNKFTPQMVTPGIRKYEHTHSEPFRSIISRADLAFDNANSILCIGYGFNDIHIHPKLFNRITNDKIPIIILARTLTDNAIKFIKHAKYNEVIGIQKNGNESKIIRSSTKVEEIVDSEIWQLSNFLKLIM